MASSPPAAARRSAQYGSPERSRLSRFLTDDHNSALSHQDALVAAQTEHDRVRENAIRAYEAHQNQENARRLEEQQRRLEEEQRRVAEEQRREEERIRAEERLRVEQERLRALKLKTVPQLPPEPEPPKPTAPAPAPAPSKSERPSSGPPDANPVKPAPAQPTPTPSAPQTSEPPKHSPFGTAPLLGTSTLNKQTDGEAGGKPSPIAAVKPPQPPQSAATANPFGKAATTPQPNGLTPSPAVTAPAAAKAATRQPPDNDRYREIHQNLKKLRSYMVEQAKATPQLRARMGDMRRELRKNVGQLVHAKGGNKKQIAAVQALLQESLHTTPSAMIDPSDYITDKREPTEGAVNNSPQLPSLFLYLMNHFAKAVVNQFINECGAQPKAADPIGVITALVFSNKAYQWRGKTLIDILMAKMRIVCPVLFGYRGSEKTQQGRARLGWKREGAGWQEEQQHIDKMKGLGVGYASIALRDFSRSANANPWPPARYWTSFARIVNTPADEISNTQAVVLRAMIEMYEARFLAFYGTAAIAALRKALVEMPARATNKTPGISGLQVFGDMLRRDVGLPL